MTSPQIRTLMLGLVLALLVVPFGGRYAAPALILIAALVAFDLWRQQLRANAPSGEPQPSRLADRPAAQRLGIVIAGFVVVIAVLLVVMKLAGTI